MQNDHNLQSLLEYLNYAYDIFSAYGERESFDILISQCKLLELYSTFNNIRTIIKGASSKVLLQREGITTSDMRWKYQEYLNTLKSEERHTHETIFIDYDRTLRYIINSCGKLNIPLDIRVYCLCLGICIVQNEL